jgi:hypothetical protein
VSVTIFFEGGGNTENTQSKCREGLFRYCAKLKPSGSRLRIVAAGGREQTFDKFSRAAHDSRAGEVAVLLVDSEGPVTANTPVQHLHGRDGWDFASLLNYKVFLMVQTMEAWFLADRDTLNTFYDGGFLPNALPGNAANIETVRKEDIGPALKKATRKTKTKGEYRKIEHGSALLALIDPKKAGTASPHAARFNEFLRSL